MQTLQYISNIMVAITEAISALLNRLPSPAKSICVLLAALMMNGCTSTAQTIETDALSEYHGLYTPSNDKEMQTAMNTNHPDYDWGLWGHNLGKIVKDNATEGMYAIVDGQRTHKQLCFSSKELYNAVRNYIIDQFGYGTNEYSERISIMPMDNKLACTCKDCTEKGNTPGNATPAVTAFVRKIAKDFPKHLFFTSAYHTTKKAPIEKLPNNVGVFISSYGLPVKVDFKKTQGFGDFVTMVKAWKRKCNRIYVWDYERNFDDYLSPFPCLLALQSRMKLYKQLGIKGIFINGSGDDYSSFDDMQSHVLAQMMDNPDIDVKKAVSDYFNQYYPQSADLLSTYYWQLEMRTKDTNHELPLYGRMKDICAAYLNTKEFVDFRRQLDAKSKSIDGNERQRLNELLTALAYTQLEMYRCGLLAKDTDMAIEMREILKGHSEIKNMVHRDESGHSIDDYLKLWK